MTQFLPVKQAEGPVFNLILAEFRLGTNTVEGCSRDSTKEDVRFLEVAFGSSREVSYLLDLAARLEMMDVKTAQELVAAGGRVSATLAALIRALKSLK